jgi:hypothetical protein
MLYMVPEYHDGPYACATLLAALRGALVLLPYAYHRHAFYPASSR